MLRQRYLFGLRSDIFNFVYLPRLPPSIDSSQSIIGKRCNQKTLNQKCPGKGRKLNCFIDVNVSFAVFRKVLKIKNESNVYSIGRGAQIRTEDLRYPKPSRYQAAPRPDNIHFLIRDSTNVKLFLSTRIFC